MASHFSANQYEDAFNSKKLRNWTIPRKYKEHPSTLEGFTQIIANDRGHLLEIAPRSKESPWGTFMGTWDMPCKIPPARPSYTARSPQAMKNLYKLKQTSPLNSAVNGYKKFEKTKKIQTSPILRPHAPSPPISDENAPKPSAGTPIKSPCEKVKRNSPRAEDVKSPNNKPPSPVRDASKPCSRAPSKPPSSAGSNRSRSPRENIEEIIDDNRSIGSAHTV